MSEGQSTIMMEGEENWGDFEGESNNTDMVAIRDDDMLDVTEFYNENEGDQSQNKGRSKSLDKGKKIDDKEVVMKKTQMIGYAYEDRRMTTKASL